MRNRINTLENTLNNIRTEIGTLNSGKHSSKGLESSLQIIFRKNGTNLNLFDHPQSLSRFLALAKCSARKQQNRMFDAKQKRIYRHTHLSEYWSTLWSNPKERNRNTVGTRLPRSLRLLLTGRL